MLQYAAGIHNKRGVRRFLRRFRMIAFGLTVALFAPRVDREQSARGLRLGENNFWQVAVTLRFGLNITTDDADFEKAPLIKRRTHHP